MKNNHFHQKKKEKGKISVGRKKKIKTSKKKKIEREMR